MKLVSLLSCVVLLLSNQAGSKETSTNQQHSKTTTQATTQTTTERKLGIMDIPTLDFPKPKADSSKKSGLAAIPTLDFSKTTKPKPSKSCSTNMCELMNGICNNGTCKPQDCLSEIVCECYPGYAGAFCDRNITEVDMAKDIPMLNGKIVSTKPPNGKTGNGKVSKLPKGNGSSKVVGNGNAAVADTASSVDLDQIGKDKYKQPKGSFVKGPEVPTPKVSKPIKVNVKTQRVKDKSTMTIKNFTDTVTIATESVNLTQSLSVDGSGQTMGTEKGISVDNKQTKQATTKNKPNETKKTSNQNKSTGVSTGDSKGSPAGNTKQAKKKSKANLSKDQQGGTSKNAKNVDKVVLSQGKVHLGDKRAKPQGWPIAPASKRAG